MPGAVESWKQKYREARKLVDESVDVLTGFNVNIDVIHRDFNPGDDKPELFEEVESIEQVRSCINYCIENGENHEVDYSDLEFEGEERIGGQGGIFSNFLSGLGDSVIFYTPLLSKEIAEEMNEKILFPTVEEREFFLKNVQDAANSDRTKKNHIFEFEGEKTGRLILSGSLKGFGPYFSKGAEEHFPLIESNIDCCILSGFHDSDGNIEAKLEKSRRQLEKIEKPIHIEYVHGNENAEKILEKIVRQGDSLGIDETELEEVLSTLGIEGEKPFNFGEAFSRLKKLIKELEISRIHLHTYRYHICVTEENYHANTGELLNSMLFGELCAILMAEKGGIPGPDDVQDFEPEYKMEGIEELIEFGEFQGIEEFDKTGTAEIDGYRVAGIPVLIHENPDRTVGMGDLISSGAFSSEFRNGG